MKHLGIIRNTEKPLTSEYAQQISDYLKEHHVACSVSDTGADLPDSCECAIVLGGDGTLLRASKVVLSRGLPLIGINLGTLGYMAEIDTDNIYPALSKLITGEYMVETRMMLSGSVYHKGREICSDTALNDIYVSGRKPLRAYNFTAHINNAYLTTYHSDGIIISTATGSTGYNLSAGGPIVSPETDIMLLTPVAPHSLISRSIILPPTDHITIVVGEGRMGIIPDVAAVSFDGGSSVLLETGDEVRIRRSSRYTRIIKINNISFLEGLRKKMADS